ncbi:hypothetical protein [Oceanobacillus chungangensis]|uniref:Uncharacterized protein n=1 Tax=Oceanobacillus chungangensis TaxID=1229152 RepID=A0A3D8PKE6_9BACI|nr:hypothetical protein [Oceanobacillus chungangensis]RDW15957.1 hypothetical protein CWR45_15795 [Oceanobacillus chungangensis]
MQTKEWSYKTTAFSEGNNPKEYERLMLLEKFMLEVWIQKCLAPNQTINYNYQSPSSYGLKHRFESSKYGFYITNGQFKGAMLAADFKPKDSRQLNWTFKLSKRAGTQAIAN